MNRRTFLKTAGVAASGIIIPSFNICKAENLMPIYTGRPFGMFIPDWKFTTDRRHISFKWIAHKDLDERARRSALHYQISTEGGPGVYMHTDGDRILIAPADNLFRKTLVTDIFYKGN